MYAALKILNMKYNSCFFLFFFQFLFLSDIIFQTFNEFIILESWTAELWKSLSPCMVSNKSWTEENLTKIESSILWKTFFKFSIINLGTRHFV